MIPKIQTEHLATHGFVVVVPNYRLAPQVTAKEAFADGDEAFDWATAALPQILRTEHSIEVDITNVVAMGHSSGGTIALQLATCKPVKAVTAFYPSLCMADTTTSAHKPTSAPPFGLVPDFSPSESEWASIKPEDRQISDASLAFPGSVPSPRNKWQMHIIKHGQWMSTLAPDGDFAAIDPLTRLHQNWPPTMVVQGDKDNVPGSSLGLAVRAVDEINAVSANEVQLEVVPGESHMFDLPPTVGTTDLGPKWAAVEKGLNWLSSHV